MDVDNERKRPHSGGFESPSKRRSFDNGDNEVTPDDDDTEEEEVDLDERRWFGFGMGT